MSMLRIEASGAAQPWAAASPIKRASSIAERTSRETPALRWTSLMNWPAFRASRTEAVATAMMRSAPRASAMERRRLMDSVARSIAGAESCPSRSVSWPSLTTSFSRAKTAKESLAAASTTTSLIEFDPTSMQAIFIRTSWRVL